MKLYPIAILSGLMLITIACDTLSATGESEPTPDVEGTVEARVQATLAAIPPSTPDLTLEKMKRVAMAEVLFKEKVVIANLLQSVRPLNPEFRNLYDTYAETYVPIYLASACLRGAEPSVKGFRALAVTWFAQEERPDRVARMMIQEIHEQISTGAEKSCLQPYLHPESVSDAEPAVGLCLASKVRAVKPLIRLKGAGWFETDQQESFLSWMCQ